MMSMSMVPQIRILQLCVICGESVQEHHKDCPCTRLEKALDARPEISCIVCKRGKVDINRSDFFECRKCHTQFTSGEYDPGGSEEKQEVIHNCNGDIYINVKKMLLKGEGDFPKDTLLKQLQDAVKQAKKEARKKSYIFQSSSIGRASGC